MRKGNSSRNSGNSRKSSRQEDKGSSRGRKTGPSSSRTKPRSSDRGDSSSRGDRDSSSFSKGKRGSTGYSSERKSSSFSSKRGAPSSYKGRKRDDDSGSSKESRGGYSSERKSSSFSSKRGAPSSYKGRKRDDESGSSRESRGGYSSERRSSSFSSKRGAPSSYKGRKRDDESGSSRESRGGYSSDRKSGSFSSKRGGSSSYGDRKRGNDSESAGKKRFGSDKPGKFSEKRPFKERTDEDRPKRNESGSDQPVKRYVRRSRTSEPQQEPESTGTLQSGTEKVRLNKYIANSGVCSRREADQLIEMGLITVNGVAITELGYKVNPTDEVRYEGKLLRAEKPVYILMNKPKGYLTTTKDPQERNTVMHIIGNAVKERVYPVGRLDRNTTGLLLLTNDGDLADKLSHPSYNVKKIYRVELDRPLTRNDFERILEGVQLEEGKARVDDLAIVSDDGKTVGVELHIGWNRVVRRIFEALEYNVVKLDRSVYAGLDKKDLARGAWRFLRKDEILHLKHFK
jgi:23S rRNA pseudouridine2605 synthase